MESVHGFDYIRLHFDADGAEQNQAAQEELKQRAQQASDAIFISHGFRDDENDATGLYSVFLANLRHDIEGLFQAALGSRKFMVGAIYWPSKAFPEQVNFNGALPASTMNLPRKKRPGRN